MDSLAGKAQLRISSGDIGVPEEVLERLQDVAVVSAAAPVVEAVVDTGLPGQGKLLILAVDMTGDRSLRDYEVVNISSLFALFIGMFIIYNSFVIAVTERRPEIGILRALGATRGQIRTLFLMESAVAGLIGSVLGVAVGLSFARSLTGLTGQMIEGMLGVSQNAQEVILDPRFLAFAFFLGIFTRMLGVHPCVERGQSRASAGASKKVSTRCSRRVKTGSAAWRCPLRQALSFAWRSLATVPCFTSAICSSLHRACS